MTSLPRDAALAFEQKDDGVTDALQIPEDGLPGSDSSSLRQNGSAIGTPQTLDQDLYGKGYTGEDEDLSSAAGTGSAHNEGSVQAGIASEEATLPPADDGADPTRQSPLQTSPSISTQEDDSRSVSGSVRSSLSPHPTLPFERRFLARQSSSRPGSSRNVSPAFLSAHSRNVSMSSQITQSSQEFDEKEVEKPWEFIRWTRLKKLTSQCLSEAGKRAFGQPTCLVVSASIVLGTAKGLILVFDYQQVLKHVIGQGTAAPECGAITSLAISADHSAVAGGHSNGSIFTWDLKQPSHPFLRISPLDRKALTNRKSDGHIEDCAVLHLGFLGMRRTALVSADDSGMAFSHLATRGFGAVARTVKTTRILGRYPDSPAAHSAAKKPSSVLAFASLPLGNVEHPTDQFGLTALLTPYLLVIVSTTPIAQTQFKSPRAKNIAAHSAMTGCLSWFPSVKLRNSTENSKTKLVFCWSNSLSILDIDSIQDSSNGPDKRPSLNFKVRTRWTCEEPILAVQWLSRSVLAILTITQRLLVLEDNTMRTAGFSDLNNRNLYHSDMFSQRLNTLVDSVEQDDATLHGVVPDAYHMSIKAYKGRLFLLGNTEVAMGVLSNWADRLSALMEAERYVEAIELATSYYSGDSEKTTVGLPEDDVTRNSIVKDKLLEMIAASLRFVFKADELDELDTDLPSTMRHFIEPIFRACLMMKRTDFLMTEVYEWYSNASCQDIFLFTLEPRILEGHIRTIPAEIFKDLTNWFASHGLDRRLEDMICSLDTTTMDIDQVTAICKAYRLYDAFIHVWNTAIDDFVTPIIDLIKLGLESDHVEDIETRLGDQQSATKVFPYLAYTLTGRIYPNGAEMDFARATRAKSSAWAFLLAPKPIRWPQPDGPLITIDHAAFEGPYPYLRCLARFDSSNLMSMLNEAFEDAFLHDDEEHMANGLAQADLNQLASNLRITRDRVVSILWDVYQDGSFIADDKVYLNMFLARNVAKYHQGFLRMPELRLRKILEELCDYPSDEFRSDCQLSVEYLLSVFHPPDVRSIIPLLRQASFFRVLKACYRSERQYAQSLEVYFQDDEDRADIFDAIRTFLSPAAGLSTRQVGDVKSVLLRHSQELVNIGVAQTAHTLQAVAMDLVEPVYQNLQADTIERYLYLQALIEPSRLGAEAGDLPSLFGTRHTETYVQLMCKHEADHVVDFINSRPSGDLRLDEVLPVMESVGVVDAAVILMARDGLARDAMARLLKHMSTLESGLTGTMKNLTSRNDEGTLEELATAVAKYVKIGIWLSSGQSQCPKDDTKYQKRSRRALKDVTEADLEPSEILWLDLISAVVQLSRSTSSTAAELEMRLGNDDDDDDDSEEALVLISQITRQIRGTVQSVFTSLLSSSTPLLAAKGADDPLPALDRANEQSASFIPILSAFLSRAATSTPSLSDLRKVLEDVFAAYAFEESILALANGLIDKDVFVTVEEGLLQRQRGWRPSSLQCIVCERQVWGAGVGVSVWEEWRQKKEAFLDKAKQQAQPTEESSVQRREASDKGKSRKGSTPPRVEPLVSFACGHVGHQSCLAKALEGNDAAEGMRCTSCCT